MKINKSYICISTFSEVYICANTYEFKEKFLKVNRGKLRGDFPDIVQFCETVYLLSCDANKKA